MDSRVTPPDDVLAAFALTDAPTPLAGGQGTSWRVGRAVVKPLDLQPAALDWLADLLTRLDGRADFRVSPPLPARDGTWTVHGWTAWRYEPGRHLAGRWPDIIATGRRFHEAIRSEPDPVFQRQRSDRWAIADRVAWHEAPSTAGAGATHLAALLDACRPVATTAQLVHCDLTGNVLFADDLPPLLIDPSLYWRPPPYASAIVVADALLFEGAHPTLVDDLVRDDPDFGQYLLRALIFRAVTDHLARGGTPRPAADDPFRPVVDLALGLV